MKSSITTTSTPGGASLGPSAVLPLVIRTRATRSPALKKTPRKQTPPLAEELSAKVPRLTPWASKYWIDVAEATSTSVNTAPKPDVVAGVVEPGTKKLTSVMLLPRAVKSRCGENVVNVEEYVALMLSNSIGVTVGLDESALTWNPEPGVEKTTPRGEVTLKKSAGRLFGAEEASGTPSQLISRRPLPKDPTTLAFKAPRSVRNASTVPWIAAAFAPHDWRTTAPSGVGSP